MIDTMNKNKGTISVFLVCILLPVMILGSLLIDQARISLAETRVVQATDITLNTTLANYDNIMKEMYGLFSTSQTTEELLDNVEKYFKRNLAIAGLDAETSALVSDGIMDSLYAIYMGENISDESYADFLSVMVDNVSTNMDLKNGQNSKTSPTLANPGILRQQIVDFMKFRAPLGIGLELIDIIKSFNTVKEQAKVIEDKTNYYKAQSKLEEHLSKAWGYLEQYRKLTNGKAKNDSAEQYTNEYFKKYYDLQSGESGALKKLEDMTKNGNSNDLTQKMETVLNSLAYEQLMAVPNRSETYKEYNRSAELYSMDGDLSKGCQYYDYYYEMPFTFKETSDGTWKYSYTSRDNSGFFSTEEKSFSFNGRQHPEGLSEEEKIEREETYLKVCGELDACYQKINEACKNEDYGMCLSDVAKDDTIDYPVAYVSYINYLDDKTGWARAYWNYCDTLRLYCDAWYALPKDISDSYQEENDKADPGKKRELFLNDSVSGRKLLDNLFKQYEKALNENFKYGNAHKYVYGEIYPLFKGVYQALTDGKIELSNASQELQNALECYDNELKTSKENWTNDSNAEKIQGSDFAESNIQEININNEKFSREDIVNLKGVVDKKVETIDKLLSRLSEFKFGSYCLYDDELKDLQSYYVEAYYLVKLEQGRSNGQDIDRVYKKQALNDYKDILNRAAEYTSVFEYNPTVESDGEKTKLNVVNLEFGTHPPKLYVYMSQMYKGASEQNSSNGTEGSDQEGSKDKMQSDVNKMSHYSADENKSENQNEQNKDQEKKIVPFSAPAISIDGSFPSKATDGSNDEGKSVPTPKDGVGEPSDDRKWDDNKNTSAMDGAGDSAGNIFGDILNVISKGIENLRNDLYIEEYIIGMFSYKTIEKETYIDLYRDEVEDNLATSLSNVNFRLYDKEEGDNNSQYLACEKYGVDSLPKNFDVEKIKEKLETLTNVPINPQNNAYYLKEVEYIIYGDDGQGVDNTIKVIRFISNTISAFMNSELTTMAKSLAMLCFGYPPLTFLVPIAQIIILIALAIGETALDMTLINGGFKVPVFKDKKTWMLSPSSALDTAKNVLIDKAKDVVEDKVSQVTDWINTEFVEVADATSEEGRKKIQEMQDALTGTLNEAYDDKIGAYISSVTDDLLRVCEQYMEMAYSDVRYYDSGDGNGERIQYGSIADDVCKAIQNLGILNGLDPEGVEYKVKEKTISVIINNKSNVVEKLLEAVDKTANHAKETVTSAIEEIPAKIKQVVLGEAVSGIDQVAGFAKGELDSFKNAAVSKVTDLVGQGKDKLLEASDSFFDDLSDKCSFGSNDGGALSSDKGKTISLGYSGYLRIMLLIALIADKEHVLSRTGDMMQANMRKITSKNDYSLSKSYTLISIDSDTYIKPLLFSFDSIDRILGLGQYSEDGTSPSWSLEDLYKINYSQMAGY